MPLMKSSSKKALEKNIETEMKDSPDKKDKSKNIAIAYSIQRQAKKKKMSPGGEVKAASFRPDADEKEKRNLAMLEDELDAKKDHMVDEDEMPMHGEDTELDDVLDSIHEAVRRKMSKGGMINDDEVDLQDNGNEHLNDEDDLSFEAARRKTYYDDSQMDDQPEDSNEHGRMLEDEDEYDMVDSIRRMIKSKRM